MSPVELPHSGDAGKVELAHPNDAGQKHLWCPFAERTERMHARGEYSNGYPEGAVVHWTSGSSAKSSLDWGRGEGYLFWMIAKDGTIFQPNPLNEWGYHAGKSSYPGIGDGVSQRLIGIEIDCCGGLERRGSTYYSWFGKKVDVANVRTSRAEQNIVAGAYEKYTLEQERSLEHLLLWLKTNNPNVFKLEWALGHDEVSPGRKTDPGGSLSSTMPLFRFKLLNMYRDTQDRAAMRG